MSAQQHVHNIFAETHDEHEADGNNAYPTYHAEIAAATTALAGHKTGAEEVLNPPALPPVTNLYNAAQKVGGSVMPHAQMLLQAAAEGHQVENSHLHLQNNRPMNIFDAAEDAYARHIADLHAENHEAVAAAVNIDNNNTAAVEESVSVPKLPPLYTKGMRETVPSAKWMKRYNELKQYKQLHGDCCVPQDAPEHKQLSSWVRTQKQQYRLLKEGKYCHMSPVRVELLNEIDFEWSGVKRDQFWKERYNELVLFHAKHKHTRVPEKYPDAPQLHSWVSLQRRQLKLKKEGKKNKLTDERLKLLEVLGIEFQIRSTASWMDRFAELKEYKAKHGDCNVPQKFSENPSLGRWVDNQKTQHKKLYEGKTTHLTIERIQHLASIGFDFRPNGKDQGKDQA